VRIGAEGQLASVESEHFIKALMAYLHEAQCQGKLRV